ncbi:MAG: hypothetical protein PHO82_12200, partial [Mesotoga sp.]|uniref:hypothetical protein n=1 Tax=Mesotoga sp. TaxID=2053577 RepID=UPI00261394FC
PVQKHHGMTVYSAYAGQSGCAWPVSSAARPVTLGGQFRFAGKGTLARRRCTLIAEKSLLRSR